MQSSVSGMDAVRDGREVRVFLSSTFKDMQAERAYLVTNVFPEVRAFCRERAVAFTDIDLRWGITDELANTGFTLDICLSEIERCAAFPPFFIGFLGERYGWIPDDADLARFKISQTGSADGRAAMIEHARRARISVTELEMRYAFEQYAHAQTHSRMFLRSEALTDSLAAASGAAGVEFRDGQPGKLGALKHSLRERGVVGVDGYASIEEFGQAVRRFLLDAIDALFPLPGVPSPRERQRRDQEAYVRSLRVAYVRNATVNDRLLALVAGLPRRAGAAFVHVRGDEAMGKSALVADIDSQLRASTDQPAMVLSGYFALKDHPGVDSWAAQVLKDLGPGDATSGRSASRPGGPAPSAGAQTADRSGRDVVEQLAARLREELRDSDRVLVILLDGLDAVAAGGSDLARLRSAFEALPRTLLVVTSTRPPTSDWEAIELQPFGPQQIRQATTTFFDGFRKELDAASLEQLAHSSSCCNPLFLRMLLEELRMHGDREKMKAQIAELAALDGPGRLFAQVLRSMRADLDTPGHANLAIRAARLMAVSWRGLQRPDLAVLLARRVAQDAIPVDPAREPGGPPCLPERFLSPVIARLDPYILNRDGYLDLLMHASLARVFEDVDPAKPRLRLLEHVEPLASQDPWAATEAVYQLSQLLRLRPSAVPAARDRLFALLGPLPTAAQVLAHHPTVFRLGVAALARLAAAADDGAGALARQWAARWRDDLGENPAPERLRQLAAVIGDLRDQADTFYGPWGSGTNDRDACSLVQSLLSGGLRDAAQQTVDAAITAPTPGLQHVDATLALLDALAESPWDLEPAYPGPLRRAQIEAWMLHRACPSSRREASALGELARVPRFALDAPNYDRDTDWSAEQRRIERIQARWSRRALAILERIGERSELTCSVLEALLRVSDQALTDFGLDRVALCRRLADLRVELGPAKAALAACEALALLLEQRGDYAAAAAALAPARAEATRMAADDAADTTLLKLLCASFRLARAADDPAAALEHARALCRSFAATASAAARQRIDNGTTRLRSLGGTHTAQIGDALALLVAAEPDQAEPWFDRVRVPLREYLAPRIDAAEEAILAIREER